MFHRLGDHRDSDAGSDQHEDGLDTIRLLYNLDRKGVAFGELGKLIAKGRRHLARD